MNTQCIEEPYLHKKSADSGFSEWIEWKRNLWLTHQTNTWCECDVQTNKWRGHRGYPPGGGETSREISGRGGAPLLSGATLSERVTNIVVDGTAAFNKHKASASTVPLSVSHSNSHTESHPDRHRNTLTRTNVHVHPLTCLNVHTFQHNKSDVMTYSEIICPSPARKCTKCAVNMSRLEILQTLLICIVEIHINNHA